jgi:citrate lyase subunit beta / citryl-CoA lyase|tara:strand:+ start:496 stop:1359 length:864 start_codon:yes stop_codon:yes gene_type:complete
MTARSLLFVPGHNLKFMESAANSKADILLPDVEDSVQPVSNKQLSRDMILSFVNDKKFNGKMIFPRINSPESGELIKDITQLSVSGIDGFMYPKAKVGSDIYFFDKLLESIETQKGFPIGTFKIIPLIETSAAVLNAQDICKASNRVIAIAYGCEDFITDLRGIHDADDMSLFVPRSLIAMAARANNVIPIDTVHVNINDLEDLEKNLKVAKNLGFEGMLALHPKELPLIHQYFSPSSAEINNARRIIELYNESERNGKGVALFGDELIGPPMVKDAKNLLNKWINK